jgi:hypothetical protein
MDRVRNFKAGPNTLKWWMRSPNDQAVAGRAECRRHGPEKKGAHRAIFAAAQEEFLHDSKKTSRLFGLSADSGALGSELHQYPFSGNI